MTKQPCTTEGCERQMTAKGLCKLHYYKKRRADIDAGIIPSPTCSRDGCERPVLAKGLCPSHYTAKRDSDRRAAARSHSRPCVVCGADLAGRSPVAKYCSLRCKERAQLARRQAEPDYKDKRALEYQRRAGAAREHMLQWAYGLSVEDYERLLEQQGDRCAICRTDEWDTRSNSPHVDHDHVTGAVRGLLCQHCNNGLGRFKDDPRLLRAAAAYLSS